MGHCGNLVMYYGQLWQILLCAMVHSGKFSYALRATAADFVICYEPLRRMKLYSKNL